MQTPLLHPTPINVSIRSSLLCSEEDLESSPTISQMFRPCVVPTPPAAASVSLSPPPSISPTTIQQIADQQPIPRASTPEDQSFSEVPKRKKNKVSSDRWFLTYPRNETLPATILQRLQALPYGVQWAIVSRETHQDGGYHLHAAVKFKRRIFVRDLNSIFDPIAEKHGNYRTIRSIPGAIAYCKKEDPNPLIFGNLPKEKSQKSSRSSKIAQDLMDGKSIQQLMREEGGYSLQNLQKMKYYLAQLKAAGQGRPTLTNLVTLKFSQTGNAEQSVVQVWLEQNLGKRDRPHKEKQIYIKAPTNYNKTSLISTLGKHFSYYMMPLQENFDDFYDDDLYDFVVLDEFSAIRLARTVQFLNQFVEGSRCPLRTKGGQVLKEVNLPVIILSNYEPSEVWKGDDIYLFNSRFTYVTLTQPLDLSTILLESTPLSS